jgi:hypothetical protein
MLPPNRGYDALKPILKGKYSEILKMSDYKSQGGRMGYTAMELSNEAPLNFKNEKGN